MLIDDLVMEWRVFRHKAQYGERTMEDMTDRERAGMYLSIHEGNALDNYRETERALGRRGREETCVLLREALREQAKEEG